MIFPGWALAVDQSPSASKFWEDRVEALREVRDDMIVIERLPMVGVQHRCGSADQHGAGDQFLQRTAFSNTSSSDGFTAICYQI